MSQRNATIVLILIMLLLVALVVCERSKPEPSRAFAPRGFSAAPASPVNVMSYGARGDGRTDDWNALTNALNAGGQVLAPRGTFLVSKPLIVPNKTQLIGIGRGDAGGVNTVIKAALGFPRGASLVQMGNQSPSFGVQVTNLTLDGSGIAGTCLENAESEELSWGRGLLLINCAVAGLWIHGYPAQNSGPFRDLEIYPAATVTDETATTLCIEVQGVSEFRGIEGVTCNGGSGPVRPNVAMQLDFQGRYSDIHVEHFATGLSLGDSGWTADGMTIQNVEFGPNVDTGVLINAGNSQNITLMGLECFGCSALLNDQVMNVIDNHYTLGLYALGDGAGTSKTTVTNGQNIQ